MNRREMLTCGVRRLARSLSELLLTGGGLGRPQEVAAAITVKEEAPSFPQRGPKPREFSPED